EIRVLICEEYTHNYWRTMTLVGVACIQVNCLQFPGKASSVQCEVDQLSAGQNCANTPSYAITISYLVRPALTLNLCKVHILDTWHLAQQGADIMYGNSAHVKSVAVKKLGE